MSFRVSSFFLFSMRTQVRSLPLELSVNHLWVWFVDDHVTPCSSRVSVSYCRLRSRRFCRSNLQRSSSSAGPRPAGLWSRARRCSSARHTGLSRVTRLCSHTFIHTHSCTDAADLIFSSFFCMLHAASAHIMRQADINMQSVTQMTPKMPLSPNIWPD